MATTGSRHSLAAAPGLPAQEFRAARPGGVWAAHITYVPTEEGWLYAAARKDLFAGEAVGRSLGARVTTDLAARALEQAVKARRPLPGLIHHSDRGSPYCGHEDQGLLKSRGVRSSISRQGNCYGNAPAESLRGTLKAESVHHRRYRTRAEAEQELAEARRLHRPVLQPAAAAGAARLPVAGG